ncbi:MAG: hypothetical protein JWM74_3443, partial [Myxococcaceae bacterium]|nr:hypothetical protein [Myxococcaceae bacterium]
MNARAADEWLAWQIERDGIASMQQLRAFDWFERRDGDNLLVRARAGTGKTWTIINGIARAPER